MMQKTLISLFIIVSLICNPLNIKAQNKREFRGAWIQCVNGQFEGKKTSVIKQNLSNQLDVLQKEGINAILFQVRAECDALYKSKYEPWSRFLTGEQGKEPDQDWDPLQWMIEQCHNRGMELHAWINPFRAKTKGTIKLSQNHMVVKHPELIFDYDGLKILNPALTTNRNYICQVIADIVERYDIDGLHIDDYFYPYPVAGQKIPDENIFKKHSNGFTNIEDWRRYNVNLFIKQLHETICSIKPWVKFGVAPFGIYRNKTSSSMGSNTKGLQNYDDLYADVLLWINNGWIDYCAPQIYWQIGHPTADYKTLIEWWNKNAYNRPIYIGEDIERTVTNADPSNPNSNQISAKFALRNKQQNVKGAILWYSALAVEDLGGYGSALKNKYWRYPALQPLMSFIDDKAPKKIRKLNTEWNKNGFFLVWNAPKGKTWKDKAHKYVVYRFYKGEKINISNPAKIVAITQNNFLYLPYNTGKTKYTYVVTALDRMQNESKTKKKNVKL